MSKDIPSAAHSMAKMVDAFHGIAKGEQPMGMRIGVVTSPYPNLVVRVDNIDITNDQIYINDYWKPDHYREAKGHIVSETQPRAGEVAKLLTQVIHTPFIMTIPIQLS